MTELIQPTLALGKPHRNQYLFADHYLDVILFREPSFREKAREEAAVFLDWLRELYDREGPYLANYNEAQLEDHWFVPIFNQLGHVYERQATVPGLEKTSKKPDYVFFNDEASRRSVASAQRTEDYVRQALAVGEVKAWPVNLSKKLGGAAVFDNNNPMFQIDYYLRATSLDWGIVSNGRQWRLVYKDSSYKLDIFFEVDLLEALTTADKQRAANVATYFFTFFRQAAFLPDSDGRIFLNEVLAGSQRYAVALENDLRDNAYRALEQLILGFFAPAANGLDPDNAADRDQVYRNSLLLLYRLLFLFYGESRGLLPIRNAEYRERSLTDFARQAAKVVDDHTYEKLPPMSRRHWAQLSELFEIIDGRNVDLNRHLGVPRYNGGLFNPERHPFLENAFVGDQHLIRAIDYLARRRKTENGRDAGYEVVDYRTLGVRQLGSIYEGLLEYRVSKAEEEMVTVRKGGKETWIPATERGKAKSLETRQPGELYLATDKGERKATGSYYTPDYIVKYIVEQTLGPLVEEARERVRAQVVASGLRDAAEKQALGARLFEEAILALNVLDPAMGSGHFLVDATNFLARALATDEFAAAADEGKDEADLTYWQRRVVEASIYGVDKNELAVELAKLSLWLVTASNDKPLSFLDHHLRHGDSLIGAWLKDLGSPPRPSRPVRSKSNIEPLFDESAFTTHAGLAVAGAATIEGLPTETIDDVHAKESTWRQIHDTHLGQWRQLADLWTSAWFGNTMSAEEYGDLARRIQGRGGALLLDEQAAVYLNHPAAVDNDYFHWELEFPEVFFDAYGRPKGDAAGFDAVVGNPPYANVEDLTSSEKSFLRSKDEAIYNNKNDQLYHFMKLGFQLVKHIGLVSMIISRYLTEAHYAEKLRSYLATKSRFHRWIDFGNLELFSGVNTRCVVFVAERGVSDDFRTAVTIVRAWKGPHENLLSNTVIEADRENEGIDSFSVSFSQFNGGEKWVFSNPIEFQMQRSIERQSIPLGKIAKIGMGWNTGYDAAFTISNLELVQSQGLLEHVYPLIKNGDIRRYETNPRGLHWISTHNLDENSESTVLRYLEQFKDKLENRYAVRSSGKQWYEYAVVNIPDVFLSDEKIIVPYKAPENRFALDTRRMISSQDVYAIKVQSGSYSHLYLLAIFNSKAMNFWYQRFYGRRKKAEFDYYSTLLEKIPIRQIEFLTSSEMRQQLLADAKLLLAQSGQLLKFVSEMLQEVVGHQDVIHDLLAYLAQQMIAFHKDKQILTADFWTDLEGATGDTATFGKLRDSGKQEASLAKEPAARPYVNPDSRSTRGLDDSLGWDEEAFKAFVRLLAGRVGHLSELTRVYRDYAPRYKEVVKRIERTDWLIDQIVYKLYGLTEEEIAIVEGRG